MLSILIFTVMPGGPMEQGGSYGQFCPVAMASEVICARWTPLILRELLCGSTRFNDLRRGVPRMSPTLLSKRLKDLEQAGVIETRATSQPGIVEYHLTAAGQELRPIVMALGVWGQRWVETQLSLKNLDPSLLMWDMRRSLDLAPLPPNRATIQFRFPELTTSRQCYWLVVDHGQVDLCQVDPGYEVDLFVECSLLTMTKIWMGLTTVKAELDADRLELSGDKQLSRSIQQWLGLSAFAKERNQRAA
ncbi:MAG: helix-turn-helix domain-containing protein [Dongiaceae bacterium]